MSMTANESANPDPKPGFSWKKWAAVATLLFGIFRLFTAPTFGDSIFGFIIAFLLFMSETKLIPQDLVIYTRNIFKYGDKFSRFLLVIIAIGGTALSVKEVFGLSLLPDWIDSWVKRSGPPLVAITIVVYCASILSKLTFFMSDIERDRIIRRLEFLFYVTVIIFCVSVLGWNLGWGFWDSFVTSQPSRQPNPLVWPKPVLHGWICATLISLIWVLCYGLCVFSRFCEWSLRDRYALVTPKERGALARNDVDAEAIRATAFEIIGTSRDTDRAGQP